MRISRRVLFSTLAAGLLGLLLLQSAPAGKGGGKKGGGDEPSEPPPMTFQIVWIDNFEVLKVNHDADLLGKVDTVDGFTYGVVYNGDRYLIEEFFVDLDASLRYTHGLSDRADDGSIFLSGTCDTVDGIRGWVMCLTPDLDGVLVRTEFSLAQPRDGHDVTNLTSVNRHGEAVGYSRFTGGGDGTAIYHTHSAGTATIPFPSFHFGNYSWITNSGDWVGYVNNGDGNSWSIYKWRPGGEVQLLTDYAGRPKDVNNQNHFVGSLTEGTTFQNATYWNYFFDGSLTRLNEEVAHFIRGLNDYDDFLYQRKLKVKGSYYFTPSLYFADLDREVLIDDMIDPQNSDEDLALWLSSDPVPVDVTNDNVVVGYIWSADQPAATFVLVPVQP